MSYSLQSDEFLSAFSQCEKISALFSASADLAAAVDFEMALARAQASLSIIPAKDTDIICKLLSETKLTPADFSQGVSTDGIYVPAFVASIRGKPPDTTAASFHKATTSQDVIDTSLMIRLRKACRHVSNTLAALQHSLKNLDQQISARTRMQNALPFSMGDKIETWQTALQACQKDQPEEFPIQLGGPIGMMHKNEPQWDVPVKRMAAELKLTPVKNPWHTNRKPVIDICSWLVSINAVLGKLGQDVCLMSQNNI